MFLLVNAMLGDERTYPETQGIATLKSTTNTTGISMDEDEYNAIEETRRTADLRSPLGPEPANPADIMDEVLGRESATCEACLETVNPNAEGDLEEGDPFVTWKLVKNVYTLENYVLLCVPCVNRSDDEWKAAVRAKRARERDYAPNLTDRLAHWVSDPTAMSVFVRRLAAAVAAVIALVLLVAIIAGIVGKLMFSISGVALATTVLTMAATASTTLITHPWIAGGLVGIAYTAHAIERVRYDPRGYLPRDSRAWVHLTAAGVLAGVGALGFLGVATGLLPSTPLATILAGVIWAIGAAGVAWYIDRALRRDLSVGIWYPARGPWMVAGRVGLLPGLLAITVDVPFSGLFPATTRGVLAAIPAGVGLAFAGRRLPYDPFARDAILEMLPDRLLAVLDDHD